jgi:hypothetical protein
MMLLTTATELIRFVGFYGETSRPGIASDHLDLFVRAGGTHRRSRGLGAGWGVIDGVAYPVVCSELVWIYTEDGRIDGRCGQLALDATGTCDAHDPR